MTVVWKHKFFKADADKVYSDIEKIPEKTPQSIVDYAFQHPESELHKCFTWDDRKAANEFRKQEARHIIALLVFKEEKEDKPSQIRVLQRSSVAYEPVKTIMRNKGEYELLLARARRELIAFKNRYKHIVELEEVLEAIDSVI